MEYTQNYQLPLWDKEDVVLRTDFNENNQKIDAALGAMPQIAYGTYKGTGTYGADKPNTLTFSFVPHIVLCWDASYWYNPVIMRRGDTWCIRNSNGSSRRLELAWDDHSVHWYASEDQETQYNLLNMEYRYIAIGY